MQRGQNTIAPKSRKIFELRVTTNSGRPNEFKSADLEGFASTVNYYTLLFSKGSKIGGQI